MRKRPERETARIRISAETYGMLEAASRSIGEGPALEKALERGMESYWSHYMEQMMSEVERSRRRYDECRKDNRTLSGLFEQNDDLRRLVADDGGGAT